MWTLKVFFATLTFVFSACLIASLLTHFPSGQPGNALLFLLAIGSLFVLVVQILNDAMTRRVEQLRRQIHREIRDHEERVCNRIDSKFEQAELVKAFVQQIYGEHGEN